MNFSRAGAILEVAEISLPKLAAEARVVSSDVASERLRTSSRIFA
jgi:hypothetical protein